MPTFRYNLFQNIAACYKKKNLLWQGLMIILTFILVNTGFDWLYYQSTRGVLLQDFLFPAVILGFVVPILGALGILIYGSIKKDKKILNTGYAVTQAGLLGVSISSFYKIFTGRMAPPHSLSMDTSHIFKFGLFRNGVFQGWPSSHTAVAFSMSVALATLYWENRYIRYGAIIYALYIGIGVSTNIHWFSDFIAGMILGTIIGIAVGKSFLERYTAIRKRTS